MEHRPLPNLHLILAPLTGRLGDTCIMRENGERQEWLRTRAVDDELDYINLATIHPGEHVWSHAGRYINDASARWLTLRMSDVPQPRLTDEQLDSIIAATEPHEPYQPVHH